MFQDQSDDDADDPAEKHLDHRKQYVVVSVEEVIDSYYLSRKTGCAEKCDPVTRLNSSEPSAQTHDSETYDSHYDTED